MVKLNVCLCDRLTRKSTHTHTDTEREILSVSFTCNNAAHQIHKLSIGEKRTLLLFPVYLLTGGFLKEEGGIRKEMRKLKHSNHSLSEEFYTHYRCTHLDTAGGPL